MTKSRTQLMVDRLRTMQVNSPDIEGSAVVSVDGRIHQRIALQEGDIREPAWSPFKTKTQE